VSRTARQTCFAGISLALGITLLYLHPADEYFFGDSISALLSRSLTFSAALRDMFRLSGTHWYRPLANGMMEYPLWEMWGLNFAPYHYFAMFLHWSVCAGLFLALRRYLDDVFAAWVGAAFFAFHPIQFYATYDICFIQEPIGVGLTLLAVACFYGYVRNRSKSALALGSVSFVVAILTREIAVMTAPLLLILLWPSVFQKRAIIAVGATGASAAAFTYVYLFVMHPLRYQPAGYTSDWHISNMAANLWLEFRWSFGIGVGPETAGWQSPDTIKVLLWICLVGTVAGALVFRQSAAWRGVAWFCVSSIPALSTHRLLPHHLYLPLMGIALWLAAILAAWRARPRVYVATAALTCIFLTAAIGARFDAVNSWVGHSSWETRLPVLYSKSVLRGMPQWRGVWIVVADGDPSFSWIYGRMFELMGNPNLETRMMKKRPESAPQGIHVLEYRNSMLWPLVLPATNVPAPAAVDLSIEPWQVRPGTSYRVRIPQLAGKSIDLKYSYNEHAPLVAYDFVRLSDAGTADVFTPRDTPWGRIDIIGVRPAGAIDWTLVHLRLEVLRD
jgi:hypothetical protein